MVVGFGQLDEGGGDWLRDGGDRFRRQQERPRQGHLGKHDLLLRFSCLFSLCSDNMISQKFIKWSREYIGVGMKARNGLYSVVIDKI